MHWIHDILNKTISYQPKKIKKQLHEIESQGDIMPVCIDELATGISITDAFDEHMFADH